MKLLKERTREKKQKRRNREKKINNNNHARARALSVDNFVDTFNTETQRHRGKISESLCLRASVLKTNQPKETK